jgi:hypothetical protein
MIAIESLKFLIWKDADELSSFFALNNWLLREAAKRVNPE